MVNMLILPDGTAVLDKGDALSADVMERGLVRADLMVEADLLPLIKPGFWIVDAGAALGGHTRAYLDIVGRSGVVFSFEPHPVMFKCLQHNCPGAVHINRPLWNERGVGFYHHSDDSAPSGGLLMKKADSACPTNTVFGPIPSVILDDYGLDKLDYFKLDVEGGEWFALNGAEQTIRRCRPILVIEMVEGVTAFHGKTSRDIYDFLDVVGYDHRSIRGNQEKYCSNCDILAWHTTNREPRKEVR